MWWRSWSGSRLCTGEGTSSSPPACNLLHRLQTAENVGLSSSCCNKLVLPLLCASGVTLLLEFSLSSFGDDFLLPFVNSTILCSSARQYCRRLSCSCFSLLSRRSRSSELGGREVSESQAWQGPHLNFLFTFTTFLIARARAPNLSAVTLSSRSCVRLNFRRAAQPNTFQLEDAAMRRVVLAFPPREFYTPS